MRPKGRPVAIETPVRFLFLHHSVTADSGPATVRSIQRFHMNRPPSGRGWSDIAYTWLYSAADRVFYEGRGPGVAGAHTSGFNRTGHAVCVLGNFETSTLPDTAVEDLARWAAWHRTSGNGPDQYTPHSAKGETACPGRNILARLDTINGTAADLRPIIGPAPSTPPTMRRGARGEDVEFLQGILGLRIDGMFGPRTEAAVRVFQDENRLAVDGVVGPATWTELLR